MLNCCKINNACFRQAVVVAVFIAVFFIQALSTSRDKSNVFDEPAHILAGFAYVTEGMDYLAPLHHPVLARSISAILPAAFLNIKLDTTVIPEEDASSNFDRYSLKFLYENETEGLTILRIARIGNIILASILGVFVFLWARRLWGEAGAYTSLFFYALSPNIIANASLVTSDLTITAFFFIAAFFLYRIYSDGPGRRQAVLSGIAIGLALTTKHTALLLAPTVILCFLLSIKKESPGRTLWAFAVMAVAAYLTIWAVYGFNFHSTHASYHGLHWEKFAGTTLEPFFDFLKGIGFLPESYLYGIAGVISSGGGGKVAFLMGEYSLTGWWYYYIAAFLIKTPVPTLALFVLSIIILIASKKRAEVKKLVYLLTPVCVIFIVVSAQNVNIGIRHILPVFPFVFLIVGVFGQSAWGVLGGDQAQGDISGEREGNFNSRANKIKAGLLAVAVIWYAFGAGRIHPHQLAYFNEFVGGPKNGYKYLVESNLDWGQDLLGLKKYMDANNIDQIKLSYFGLSHPSYYGIDYIYMPSFMVLGPKNKGPIRAEGYFAISATMLQGVYMPNRRYFGKFRDMEPVATIGHSIFIYKF